MGVFRGVKYRLTREDRVRGGKTMSPARFMANKINPLKNGKHSKDQMIIEHLHNPMDKLLGIKTADRLRQMKEINPSFLSENGLQILRGVEVYLSELYISALQKKKNGKITDYEFRNLIRLTLDLYDRMYGKPPNTVVNVNQINNNITSYANMLKQILGEPEEIIKEKDETNSI